MATLTIVPPSVVVGAAPRVDGAGFEPLTMYRLYLDGRSRWSFRAAPDGTWHFGLTVLKTVGSHLIEIREQDGVTAVVSATYTVEKAGPPPPPPDTTPPVISNIVVGTITTTGASVAWSLSEPGTGQIEYGPTTAYGSWSTKETGLLSAHKQVLSGLTPGTTYHFRVHSADAAGNANASADQTFLTTGNVPGPPPPPPVTGDIQKAIDAAPAGSFLDLTGATYSGIIKVTKSLHIKGGSITGPASGRAYVVDITGADVELEGMAVTRGFAAIVPHGSKNTVVHDCVVKNIVYAGIFALGQQGGRHYNNHIDGVSGSTADGPWNAYGITLSFTGPMTKGVTVEDNLVEHVPVWHGIDTHGGIDCIFRGNTVRSCRRAIWSQNGAVNLLIEGNDLTCPTAAEQAAIPAGAPVTFGTDVRGISLAGGSGIVRNNTGHNYPASRWFNPIGSVSGYSFSGNNPTIP